MTLTKALLIDEKFLKYEDMRALDHCENRWKEAGEPKERWQMINFLEKMMQELKHKGGYPKIILLRKKEIQRQQFTIRIEEIPAQSAQPISECSCFDGWLVGPNGAASSPCSCPKGEPHKAQLRKWGMQV